MLFLTLFFASPSMGFVELELPISAETNLVDTQSLSPEPTNPQTIVPSNIKLFCDQTQNDYKDFNMNTLFHNKSSQAVPGRRHRIDPWQLNLVPSTYYRRAAFYAGLKNLLPFTQNSSDQMVNEWAEDTLKDKQPAEASKLVSVWRKRFKDEDQKAEIDNALKVRSLLCASYTLFHVSDCSDALAKILEVMKPVHDLNLTSVITEVYEDQTYRKGLNIAALEILKKTSGSITDGNLFDDLVASYEEAGLDKIKATEHAWNILGIVSTNGSNTASFINSAFTNVSLQFLVAIQIISSGPQLIDSQRINDRQNAYTYPAQISTTCNYGKPYHFWMTAFLVHKMGLTLGVKEGALYAAWLAQLGYQMKAKNLHGRDPDRPFTVKTYDRGNNKIRIDLAFAGAGAMYGLKSLTNETVPRKSVDEAIRALMNAASSIEIQSKEDAAAMWGEYGGIKGYLSWRKIFSPDISLEYYLH